MPPIQHVAAGVPPGFTLLDEARALGEGEILAALEDARSEDDLADVAFGARLPDRQAEEALGVLGARERDCEGLFIGGAIRVLGGERPDEKRSEAQGEGGVARSHECLGRLGLATA